VREYALLAPYQFCAGLRVDIRDGSTHTAVVPALVCSTTHLRGFSYAIETCLPTLIECEACHK
jgi:hypothetical protein